MNREERARRRIALAGLVLSAILVAGGLTWWGIHWGQGRRQARQAVLSYIERTEEYSAPAVWPVLRYTNPRTLSHIYATLSAITPPPEMAEAHAALLEGYRFTMDGQEWLFQSVGDGEMRAEAEFLLSWGLARVQEHYRQVQEYRR